MNSVLVGVLEAVLRLRDEMSPALRAATSNLQQSGATMQRVGGQMQSAGTALTAGLTLPLVGVATAAVRTGLDFERSMNQIKGVARPTADELERIRSKAIEMGAATVFSATDAANALLELQKAGLTAEQSMSAVDKVMQLAAATGLSMAEAAEMSARTLAAFGLEIDDLSHVNDVLAGAVNKSTLEIQDLAVGFRYVGPIAKSFGMDIEQTSAALAIMRDNGIAAETSGRTLREALGSLANPTGQTKKAMEELGIASFEVNGRLMNLSEIIELLRGKNIDAATALQLFGNAAGPGMMALIDQGRPALDGLTKQLREIGPAAKDMADAMMEGLPGAFERLKGSVETALLGISKTLEPALLPLFSLIERGADLITNTLVPAFQALPAPVQTVVAVLLSIAVAAGPVLVVLGTMVQIAGLATSGLGLLSGALFKIGNTVPVLTARLWLMDAAAKAMPVVLTAIRAAVTALSGPWGWLAAAVIALVPFVWKLIGGWDGVKGALSGLGSVLRGTYQFLSDIATIVGFLAETALRGLWKWFTDLAGAAMDLGRSLATWVLDKLRTLADWVSKIPGLSTAWGGFVSAVGATKDAVVGAARATGEFVDGARRQVHDTAEAIRTDVNGSLKQTDAAVADWKRKTTDAAHLSLKPSVDAGELLDALDKTKRGAKDVKPELKAVIDGLGLMEPAGGAAARGLGKTTDAANDSQRALKALRDELSGADVLRDAQMWERVIKDIGGAQKLTTEEARRAGDAFKAVADKFQLLGPAGKDTADKFRALYESLRLGRSEMQIIGEMKPTGLVAWKLEAKDAAAAAEEMVLGLDRLRSTMTIVGEIDPFGGFRAPDPLTGEIVTMGDQMVRDLEAYEKKHRSVTAAVRGNLRDALRHDLAPTILQAATGGGDIGKSVGGLLAGNIFGSLTGALDDKTGLYTNGVGKVLQGALGKTIGGALGSVIPGLGTMLGTMVGPLLGKLWGGIKNMFGGPSQQELEGRAAADQFTQTISKALTETQRIEAATLAVNGNSREWADSVVAIKDAYLATGRTVEQALRDRERLYAAEKQGADAVKRVIDDISVAFEEQAADAARLEAAMQKYGITAAEAGAAFQAREITAQAKELIEDWRVLNEAGVSLTTVNEKMAGSFNEFLQLAIRTGAEVPIAMRPILQNLVDQGKLVDANGNAITDLAATGVTFAETMTQGFDRIVQRLDLLIQRLQGTGHAIESLPSSYVLKFTAAGLDEINAEIESLRSGGALSRFRNAPEIARLSAERDALAEQLAQGSQTSTDIAQAAAQSGNYDIAQQAAQAAAQTASTTTSSSVFDRFSRDAVPGFSGGTMGQFLDFGSGTDVRLHGRERVVTEDEDRREKAAAAAAAPQRTGDVILQFTGDITVAGRTASTDPMSDARAFLKNVVTLVRRNDGGVRTTLTDLTQAPA